MQPLTSTTGHKAAAASWLPVCPGSGRPCLGSVNQDDRPACLWSSGLPLRTCASHKSFSTLRTLQSLLWCPCLLSSVTQFSLLNNWTGWSLVSWKSSHGHGWCHLESEHLHVQFWRTGTVRNKKMKNGSYCWPLSSLEQISSPFCPRLVFLCNFDIQSFYTEIICDLESIQNDMIIC